MQFRKTTIRDIELIMQVEAKYENFVGQWCFEQHQSTLNDSTAAHIVFYTEEHPFIGYAILRGLLNENKNIELMRIAIDQPNRGNGEKAIKLLLDWCFNELKAHRVWLDVRKDNARAQKVYSRMGFKVEGLLRDCILIGNKFESLYVMSILENEYGMVY